MGQSCPALGAAALQYLLARAGSHALQEAMFAGAAAFFGLVGSLWHMFLNCNGISVTLASGLVTVLVKLTMITHKF
jgi:hypothetical protein